MNKHTISFPHMGDYSVPASYLLSHIVDANIMIAPKITNTTIELGTKYSPEFVCTPFKYTLGTFIEALDRGADVLIQAGGGCRYGYYCELQEKILKDLGYEFTYINLMSKGKKDLKKIYNSFKKIDSKFKIVRALYYFLITKQMVKYMDRIDDYIRKNIGFEREKGSFEKLKNEMLESFKNVKNLISLRTKYAKYRKKFKKIPIKKCDKKIRVGVIGELYTIMEPFANYNLECELAQYGIEIKRYTNVHYLLFEKGRAVKKYLKYAKEYAKYRMGADALDNIGRTKYLCENKYDGIIHIKSSFCTPEIGAMPVINKICKKYGVPVIFFSFDSATSEVGIKTRIEAFYDMIEMRKDSEKLLSGN